MHIKLLYTRKFKEASISVNYRILINKNEHNIMSDSKNLPDIAAKAERDLNSNQAKSGTAGSQDDSGVNTSVENKFPGAQVTYGDDLTTSGSYDRKIPPSEGGDLDSKGRWEPLWRIYVRPYWWLSRQTRGYHFEGRGGPEDKERQAADDRGGDNDGTIVGGRSQNSQSDAHESNKDVLGAGSDAVSSNLSGGTRGTKSNFKGEDYYEPETVPDTIADQGEVPPDSVIASSNRT